MYLEALHNSSSRNSSIGTHTMESTQPHEVEDLASFITKKPLSQRITTSLRSSTTEATILLDEENDDYYESTSSSSLCEQDEEVHALHQVQEQQQEEQALSITPATKKHVTFGTMEIYTHRYILGDNPSVKAGSRGPPLTIAWEAEPQLHITTTVDDYELESQCNGGRRPAAQMLLPSSLRYEMMKRAGYCTSEIQDALQQAAYIRTSRQRHATRYLRTQAVSRFLPWKRQPQSSSPQHIAPTGTVYYKE